MRRKALDTCVHEVRNEIEGKFPYHIARLKRALWKKQQQQSTLSKPRKTNTDKASEKSVLLMSRL